MGLVQYETFGYPDGQASGPSWENFFAATVRGSGQLSSTLTWQFEGRAVADDVGFTAGAYSPRNANVRRPYLSLITAVLDYRPAPNLRISVGKQIVNWSILDVIQPANLMTTHDESDAFRSVELGVPSIAVHYDRGSAYGELVVVPLAFTPSRLPQGRWNIIQPGSGVIERQDLPPVRLDETQAGARVGAHIGQLEASLIGYVGRDTEANFVPGPLIFLGIVNGAPRFLAQIINQYPRMRASGVTASYPLGDRLLLRTEVVYYNSPDPNRDDFVHTAGPASTLSTTGASCSATCATIRRRAPPKKSPTRASAAFFRASSPARFATMPAGACAGTCAADTMPMANSSCCSRRSRIDSGAR